MKDVDEVNGRKSNFAMKLTYKIKPLDIFIEFVIISIMMWFQVIFHNDFTTLHKYVPKDMLPEEYGGDGVQMDEVNSK